MKKLILAAALVVVGATGASAQHAPWRSGDHPYAQRHHSVCQTKARQLHGYENRASSDGRLSWRERRTIESLRSDLRRTCGGFRWRG
ncbi:MAG: hypothetical protein ABL904_22760 [Hyphomicrobiaceae bacterium]